MQPLKTFWPKSLQLSLILPKIAAISGDFNIDLLQINDRVKYQKYFDVFFTNSLFPLITLPTRESKHSSTLIDQIFCKLKNFWDLDSSGILISSLSDHYPCFALLDICKKKKHKPKFITINNKNEQALASFCTEVETSLNMWQINNDLMTDPNENYNIFEKIILDAQTKHLSPKSVRFKKYKHKISPWINNDILRSIRERDDLHKTLVSTASDAPNHDMLKHDLQNLKATLKKKIRCAKAKYYADIFDKNKSNIRHTWAAVKEILGKFNKNTLETCKNPRPTSGWSELTKSCTTSTMNFHMAYFSWIPQNNAKFKLSCKFGESKCNPC